MAAPDVLALIDEQIVHHRREIERLETARKVVEELSGRKAGAKPAQQPFLTIRRSNGHAATAAPKRKKRPSESWTKEIAAFLPGRPPMTSREVVVAMGKPLDGDTLHGIGTALWHLRKQGAVNAERTEKGPLKWRYSMPAPPQTPEEAAGRPREQ